MKTAVLILIFLSCFLKLGLAQKQVAITIDDVPGYSSLPEVEAINGSLLATIQQDNIPVLSNMATGTGCHDVCLDRLSLVDLNFLCRFFRQFR